jgi:nucleotide-binding universal stress UspA family protein
MDLNHILVPTDFSPAAEHALHWAQHLAHQYDATLHLLHVVAQFDAEWFGDDDASVPIGQMHAQVQRDAKEGLKRLAPDPDETGIRTQQHVRYGDEPAASILTVADEINADLIVTGTHGREGLAHVILGSVAEKVVRHARCPVLTVGAKAPDQPAIQRVLAPLDFSDPSKRALRLAKEVAAPNEAHLDMLFVAEERTMPIFSDTGIPRLGTVKMDPEIVNNATQGLEQLIDTVGGSDVPSSGHVAKGNVPDQIVEFAKTHEVDLIVMATRGLSGLNRFLLGSVAERVVRAAPCPVLTLNTHEEEGSTTSPESRAAASG